MGVPPRAVADLLALKGDSVDNIPGAPGIGDKGARDLIVRFARSRGIAEGSAADLQLTSWMANQPSEAVFAGAGRLIRAVLDSGADPGLNADDLVAYAEKIASASGGVFGIGKISSEERKLLSGLADDLKGRKS